MAVAVAAVAVLLLGVPMLLAFGPVFTVRTITVTGASAPIAAAVRSALRAELGRPVATVGDDDVAALLKAVPAVDRFTVVRRPPGALEVVVTTRTAIAQRRTGDGWEVLDAAGIVLERRTGSEPGLPVVQVPAGSDDARGAWAAAVAAISALDGRPAITRVVAASSDDVVLRLASGLRVRWGGAEDGALKAEALRAALHRAARTASEVDVSSPGVVLTR